MESFGKGVQESLNTAGGAAAEAEGIFIYKYIY